MNQERFDRIRLARSANVGPITYRQLIKRFGSAGEALRALPDLARRGGGRNVHVADERAVDCEISRIASLGAHWLIQGDADYPFLLDQIADAPPVLTYRGNAGLFGRPCIAMVGARNASAAACRFARGLAQDLVDQGGAVVSGLARNRHCGASGGLGWQ